MVDIVRLPIKLNNGSRKRNVYVQNPSDVKRLINNIINDLRNGEIDSKRANSIGYLANILLKTFEVEELGERLKDLEARLEAVTEKQISGTKLDNSK